MAPFPAEITTDRLVATRVDLAADIDEYATLFADPRVAEPLWPKHLGGVRTREQSEAFVGHFDAHWQCHGFGPWTVRERDGGAFVGQVGLGHTIVAGRAEVEAGFIVAADLQRRGYATELTRLALQHAPALKGLSSVVAFATKDNAPALAVLDRTGFAHEADAILFELDCAILRAQL
jgi:RimJ/RimL family protein N-acetyltransferase